MHGQCTKIINAVPCKALSVGKLRWCSLGVREVRVWNGDKQGFRIDVEEEAECFWMTDLRVFVGGTKGVLILDFGR